MKEAENDTVIPPYAGPDSSNVRQMFAGIAHRYDFLNHFLSASVDRYWRRAAVQTIRRSIGPGAQAQFLDVCCGTGDLALDLHRSLGGRVVASDFCHPMLTRSTAKIAAAGVQNSIRAVEADALTLPFTDASFDVVTIGFGLRNLEDIGRGLNEMRRVLRSEGLVVILEFSKPVIPVFRHAFNLYFRYVLPPLGAIISGDRRAYQYLPDSVRKFPAQDQLAQLMRSVGLKDVGYRNLTGGIAALHWGRK